MLKPSLDSNTIEEVIGKALEVLKRSGIVAYPTESFYALGAAAYDEAALEKLFMLKKRPVDKAMPLIVGSKDVLKSMVKTVPPEAEQLMARYWPGPLTLIFNAKDDVPRRLTSRVNKIAIRIPGESFALHLAAAAHFPVTATSANISGELPAQSAEEVIHYFGDQIDLVIDGPRTPGGKPSTIVDVTGSPPKVLREGSVLLNEEG